MGRLGQKLSTSGEIPQVGSERTLVEGVDKEGIVGIEGGFLGGIKPSV
jgi:hypothetical protein